MAKQKLNTELIGTNQKDREKAASPLFPDYFLLDDKNRADHLYWVFQVSKLLNYFDDQGKINNQPGWVSFFKNNPDVVYALIYKVRFSRTWESLKKTAYYYADYGELRARVATLLKTDLEYDHDARVRIIHILLLLIEEVHTWYEHIGHASLKPVLENHIAGKISELVNVLRIFLECFQDPEEDKGKAFDYQSADQIFQLRGNYDTRFNPREEAVHRDQRGFSAKVLIQRFAEYFTFLCQAKLKPQGVWALNRMLDKKTLEGYEIQFQPVNDDDAPPFVCQPGGLKKLVHDLINEIEILRNLAHRKLSAENERNDQSPQNGLLVSFLELWDEALKPAVNTLPSKHIDFFFQEVLQLKLQEAKPDKAIVSFELAPEFNDYYLPRGTALYAGTNEEGQDRLYQTIHDATLGSYQVNALKSLFLSAVKEETDSKKVGRSHLYAAPVANSKDGIGTPFETPEKTFWAPFGKDQFGLPPNEQTMTVAPSGLVLASPIFYVAEGIRTFTVSLSFSKPTNIYLPPLTEDDLKKNFQLFFSTEEGWLEVMEVRGSSESDLQQDPLPTKLTIHLELRLGPDFPPVIPIDQEISGLAFGSDFPMLKILPREDFQYLPFNELTLKSVEVELKAAEIKQLAAYNDFGPLDLSQPFQPFGTLPEKGARFSVGSREVFSKNIEALDLHIEWSGLPEDKGGFTEYYRGYREIVDVVLIEELDKVLQLQEELEKQQQAISDLEQGAEAFDAEIKELQKIKHQENLIAELNAKISGKTAEITTLDKALEILKPQINVYDDNIKRRRKQIKAIEKEEDKIQDKNKAIGKKQGEINTLNDEITKLDGELKQLTQELTNLQTDIQSANVKLLTISSEYNKAVQDLQDTNGEIARLKGETEKRKTQLKNLDSESPDTPKRIADLTKEIINLNLQLATQQSQLAARTAIVEKLKQDLAVQQSQIDAKTSNINVKLGNIDRTKLELTAKNNRIKSLNDEIETLNNEITTFNNSLGEKQTLLNEKEKFEDEKASFQATITSHENDIKGFKKDIKGWEDDIKDHEKEIGKIEKKVSELEEGVDRDTQISNRLRKITDLQNEVAKKNNLLPDLKSRIEDLSSSDILGADGNGNGNGNGSGNGTGNGDSISEKIQKIKAKLDEKYADFYDATNFSLKSHFLNQYHWQTLEQKDLPLFISIIERVNQLEVQIEAHKQALRDIGPVAGQPNEQTLVQQMADLQTKIDELEDEILNLYAQILSDQTAIEQIRKKRIEIAARQKQIREIGSPDGKPNEDALKQQIADLTSEIDERANDIKTLQTEIEDKTNTSRKLQSHTQHSFFQPEGTVSPDFKPDLKNWHKSLPEPLVLEPNIPQGFMQFELQMPAHAFGHKEYPIALSNTIIFNSDPQITVVKPKSGINWVLGRITGNTETEEKVEKSVLPLPNQPYTPTIKSLSLSYSSKLKIDFDGQASAAQDADQLELFHLHPFGHQTLFQQQRAIEETELHLFPHYEHRGHLYIGLDKLILPGPISLYFQIAEDSSLKDATPPPVEWYYLADNTWHLLEKQSIISDEDEHFLHSASIQIDLPGALNRNNTILPANLYWIRASVLSIEEVLSDEEQDTSLESKAEKAAIGAFGMIKQVFTNAVEVEMVMDHIPADANVPAGTIQSLRTDSAAITAVIQPEASYQGTKIEAKDHYNLRVSERLAHKNRAISKRDIERMVLEAFPNLISARCVKAKSELGKLYLLVMPARKRLTGNIVLKPRLNRFELNNIEDYLSSLSSPFAEIKARNPAYEELKISLAVELPPGSSGGLVAKQLNQALIQFLSPWAFRTDKGVSLRYKISMFELKSFIQKQGLTKSIMAIRIAHLAEESEAFLMEIFNQSFSQKEANQPQNEISIKQNTAILVSAPGHAIRTFTSQEVAEHKTAHEKLEKERDLQEKQKLQLDLEEKLFGEAMSTVTQIEETEEAKVSSRGVGSKTRRYLFFR